MSVMTFEEIAAPMATPPAFRALGWHRSAQLLHFLTPNPTKQHVYRRQARPTPTWRQSGFVIGFSLFTKTHPTRPPAQAATAERNGLFPAGPTRPERLISYPVHQPWQTMVRFFFFFFFGRPGCCCASILWLRLARRWQSGRGPETVEPVSGVKASAAVVPGGLSSVI